MADPSANAFVKYVGSARWQGTTYEVTVVGPSAGWKEQAVRALERPPLGARDVTLERVEPRPPVLSRQKSESLNVPDRATYSVTFTPRPGISAPGACGQSFLLKAHGDGAFSDVTTELIPMPATKNKLQLPLTRLLPNPLPNKPIHSIIPISGTANGGWGKYFHFPVTLRTIPSNRDLDNALRSVQGTPSRWDSSADNPMRPWEHTPARFSEALAKPNPLSSSQPIPPNPTGIRGDGELQSPSGPMSALLRNRQVYCPECSTPGYIGSPCRNCACFLAKPKQKLR